MSLYNNTVQFLSRDIYASFLVPAMSDPTSTGNTDSSQEKDNKVAETAETRWTDDSIRWPDDPPKTYESDEEETGFMDPFKDPDPFQLFEFKFDRHGRKSGTADDADRYIDLKIRGYKEEADEIWQSTGLTLWRASDYLCEYQVMHPELFQGKRVLEVSRMCVFEFTKITFVTIGQFQNFTQILSSQTF